MLLKKYLFLLLVILNLAMQVPAHGQEHEDFRLPIDTNYVLSYDTMITGRFYLANKYVGLTMKDKGNSERLTYLPNSKLLAGVGVTYGWLNLNVGVGVAHIYGSKEEKGKTKNLDLQLHLASPKLFIDFLGQIYKGFYLYKPGEKGLSGNYVRPDLRILQAGVSGLYVLNWKRFSGRAAFMQNEWQVKSAGSFLVGADIFYENATADSAFVPAKIKAGYQSADVKEVSIGDFGPAAGYAYTFVIARHFFITLAGGASLSVNVTRETTPTGGENRWALNPNFGWKGAVGYNSARFTTSIAWGNNSITGAGQSAFYTVSSGLTRFAVAYRFPTSRRYKKLLHLFSVPPTELLK